MNMILVDDHPLIRKGLKTFLEENRAYRVVGEAGSGAEAIKLIYDLKPHIAILDIKLPDMSGFQIASAAKQHSPATRIIMLSMHADEFHINEAFRSGADGYVVKNAMEHEMAEAIQAVTNGGRYLSKVLAQQAAGDTQNGMSPLQDEPYQTLTNREREVFCLIAQGYQNKEIAEKLFISFRTVETHRAKIMRKLQLNSPAELIHFAVRRNIISVT